MMQSRLANLCGVEVSAAPVLNMSPDRDAVTGGSVTASKMCEKLPAVQVQFLFCYCSVGFVMSLFRSKFQFYFYLVNGSHNLGWFLGFIR